MCVTSRQRFRLFILVPLFLSLLASCSPAQKEELASGELKGTITVSGAFALYPMMIRWGEEFHKLHSGVTFDISAGGAGKGMADALGGAVDIGMVSRTIFDEEVQKGAFWVAACKDAVIPTISAENPVLDRLLEQGITRATVEAIWITGQVATWGQVVNSSATDAIHVFTRADACGAAQTWAEYMGDYAQEDLLGIAVQADPGLAEAVRQDPLAIGFNNLNFAYDADTRQPVSGLQIIPLDVNENGKIDADEDFYANKDELMAAIVDGRYPSPPARALNLVTGGKPQGLVNTFITWVLTDGQQYLEEVGYIQVSRELLEEGLTKLK
jgi:phosphate transport system substrate-binding protein